jgi:hypothetical protein
MVDFIIAPVAIFILFGSWLLVQHITREFAKRHPELGPYHEEGSGCSGSCHECNSNTLECNK